jgi:Zn-dependent protease
MIGGLPKVTLWRLRGIPIRLEASFVLVPIFLLVGTSANSTVEFLSAVVVGTVGIFLSILLHEGAHASVAKILQVGVSEIVVGGFYGYASLKRQAIPRKMLIRILAAGPFANLVIFLALWGGLAFVTSSGFAFGSMSHPLGAPWDWLAETVRVLALVNLAMFVFNMVPAFPLDGGRILGLFLDRLVSAEASKQVVAGLSLLLGAAMILLGFGINAFLAVIGVMIVMTNYRRLRRRRVL